MLTNIQALRALAAYLVVFLHLQGVLHHWSGVAPFAFGHAGVDIFFVISGFIMVYTTHEKPTTPLGFAYHRILRVVPLYWLITFAVFAIALVAPALLQATRPAPMDLIKSLLFVPFQKSNGLIQPVVFVGWTLNYEMFFYLLFTLSLFVKNREIALLAIIILLGVLVAEGISQHPNGTLAKFYTNSIVAEFALGMIIGSFYAKIATARRLVPYSFLLLPVAAALIVMAPIYWSAALRLWAYGVPAAIILAAVVNLEGGGFAVRNLTIKFLGAASYAIYLTHFFVTQIFMKLGAALHTNSFVKTVPLFLMAITGVTLIGSLIHLKVERPLTKWLRSVFAYPSEVKSAQN